MRNLKRALSLVLAVVMVIGLMVVGASAVSYNDLTDKDEIVNKDAVSMLVALDIIQGRSPRRQWRTGARCSTRSPGRPARPWAGSPG